jgi:hypothetical protein
MQKILMGVKNTAGPAHLQPAFSKVWILYRVDGQESVYDFGLSGHDAHPIIARRNAYPSRNSLI